MQDDLLNTRQAAEALGRSGSAVRSYIRYCGLPARRLGNQHLISRDDLAEWRARPEIAAMMAAGAHVHGRRRAAASA